MKDEISRALMGRVLRDLHIFKGLTDEQLARLMESFSVVHAKKGETILFQTEESTDFYIVFEGVVRASLSSADGQELILADFVKGDFLVR